MNGSGLLGFPVDEKAESAISLFRDGSINLVVLNIDVAKEVVILDFSDSILNINELIEHHGMVNGNGLNEPRYILYRWNEGNNAVGKVIFALTVPGSSKVKERTLYSSTRGSIISFIEKLFGEGFTFAKKLELDHPKDFTVETLRYELGDALIEKKPAFAKPVRPKKF